MAKSKLARREFCGRMLGAAGAALVCYPAAVKAGASRTNGSSIIIDLTAPENEPLLNVGGGVYVENPQEYLPMIVTRLSETKAAAFSSECTHHGCKVDLPKENVLTCPCHFARYDLEGHVTRGPALSDLKAYAATIESDSIVVALEGTGVRKETSSSFFNDGVTVEASRRTINIHARANREIADVAVYAIDGALLRHAVKTGPLSYEVRDHGLPSGTYIIRLRSEGKTISRHVRF